MQRLSQEKTRIGRATELELPEVEAWLASRAEWGKELGSLHRAQRKAGVL